jgi:hypothetical protein
LGGGWKRGIYAKAVGFVEKTAGEGRVEVLVGASFRDVSVEDALKKS